ncbi:MAG TPA: hypothetical protein VFW71_05130 [Actinomycetota bacterium]|nr:hypothetical protein [Actinomycetota bacterium]
MNQPRTARAQTRSRGLGILILLLCMMAAACSSKAKTAAKTSATPSPTGSESQVPALTATVVASPPPSPSPSPSPVARRPSPSPTHAVVPPPSPTHAVVPPSPTAVSSAISLPVAGTYTYGLSGTYQTPLLGSTQNYPAGAQLPITFSNKGPQGGGTEIQASASSSTDNATTTTTWIFQPTRVVVTDSTLTLAGLANYDCTFSPPPEILPNPIVAGALPGSSWSTAQCSGDVAVTVQGASTIAAAGKTWDVWTVHTVLHYQAQSSVNVTVTSTTTFAPSLGTVITSDATTTGTVAGSPFQNHQVTTLLSAP